MTGQIRSGVKSPSEMTLTPGHDGSDHKARSRSLTIYEDVCEVDYLGILKMEQVSGCTSVEESTRLTYHRASIVLLGLEIL